MTESFVERHLGTDAQRNAWFFMLVMIVVVSEQLWELLHAKEYYIISLVYLIGGFLGIIGCVFFTKASYPDAVVSSCFYSNNGITPPPGSWWWTVHFGTCVLVGGQLQFFGALLYAGASAAWIHCDYTASISSGIAKDSTEYIYLICGSGLLVNACYTQLLGQYPQSLLIRTQKGPSGQMSNLQISAWCFEILGVLWLIRSTLRFDYSTTREGPKINPETGEKDLVSVPFSDYDWGSFLDLSTAFFLALGSYFSILQAYREGTRMDTVLVQQANRASEEITSNLLGTGALSSLAADAPMIASAAPATKPSINHPLSGVRDLTDFRAVLHRGRSLLNTSAHWTPTVVPPSDPEVFIHKSAHAVKFETSKFKNIDPILLASLIQSETFKAYQISARSVRGSSVSVVGKVALSTSVKQPTRLSHHTPPSHAIMFAEKFPPNAPMPAHESTFASLLNETRKEEDYAELIEWSVSTGASVGGASTSVIKVNPFRYLSVSSEGKLSVCVWLEEIARWMPDFLLRAEMNKVPTLVGDIESFLGGAAQELELQNIEKNLHTWIWQKVHNSISPLSAGVLVRTSPAYRVLLSKFPGLRTRVPEQVSVPVGALGHPLECFPTSITKDEDVDVAVATKHASDFVSNEFGSWHATTDEYVAKPGKPRISIWRQKLDGEAVRPFRIQARIHGVDPLTLATMIHRNRLDDIVQRAVSNLGAGGGVGGLDRRPSTPGSPTATRISIPETGSVSGHHTPGDHEHGGVTVANQLVATYQDGSVRVYRERKRRTKFMPAARDREFTFASVMRDVSPLKAVVVHFGVNLLPSQTSTEEDVVRLRKFQAWTLENDGGTDTKLTWCGLVPIGGRMEKMSSWLSSGSELKEKIKFMERLVNVFVSDFRAKEAVAETHSFVAYSVIRFALQRELRRLSVNFLAQFSDDYKTLLNEVQPTHKGVGSIMAFDMDTQVEGQESKRRRESQRTVTQGDISSNESDVTIPLSSVPSHIRLTSAILVDEDEVRTQKRDSNSDMDDYVIPNERDVR